MATIVERDTSSDSTAPALSGLAAGITLILVLSLLSAGIQPIVYSHYQVLIQGLKERYEVGEQVDFSVRVKGYGIHSCGYPHVAVKDAGTGEVVWAEENFALVVCDPDVHAYDFTWLSKDWSSVPIVIDRPGAYAVEATFDGTVAQKFIVT